MPLPKQPKDDGGWQSSTTHALSKVCRKRWRTLDLAAGSPTPPMRINCASVLLRGELYLFGGLNAGPSKSLWALNVRERRWRPIPAKKGMAPAPRQGHTMCWGGRSSLWVFGGQGTGTSSTDACRTHQGVKIRSLVKRTCFNDFHEFDTHKMEWRDHVQAGVCPTSRRGHTATLVLGRRPTALPTAPQPTEAVHGGGIVGSSGTKRDGDGDGGVGGETTAGSPDRGSTADRSLDVRHSAATGGARRSPRRGVAWGDEPSGRALKGRRTGVGGGGGEERRAFRERCLLSVAPGRTLLGTSKLSTLSCGFLTSTLALGLVWRPQKAGGDEKTPLRVLGAGGAGAAGPGAPAVFDHTATIAAGKHIVVVGGVMVGTTLNKQVYMLSLDTLRWSAIVPHPTGFSPPAVHGHTTVEDPNAPGRLIVFGGRGGTHWNTEVLTFHSRKGLWSMAVCDTAPSPQDGTAASSRPVGGRNKFRRELNASENATGNHDATGEEANSNNYNLRQEKNFGAVVTRQPFPEMPHQRNGHTCFVWDPRDEALAACGGTLSSSSSLAAWPASKRGGTAASREVRSEGGGSHHKNPHHKRSRGGGGGGTAAGAGKHKTQRSPGGGVRGKREDLTDDPLPSPCIVTFGGSALRVGGGYAEAALHVLETPPPEKIAGEDDEDGEGEEGANGAGGGIEGEGVRKASSTTAGAVNFVESADTSATPTSKFQSCTKSVILKVHSLRQLGKQRLTFENSYRKGDLSYIEFKVRSVIFGEGKPNKEDASLPSAEDESLSVSPRAEGTGTALFAKPQSTSTTGRGVFPASYEQVKSFLAEARPVDPNKRPASAPPGSGDGGGGGETGGARAIIADGGAVVDRNRGGSRGLGGVRCPSTAGAAVPIRAGHGNQHSSLPPMMPSLDSTSPTSLCRHNHKAATGNRNLKGAAANSSTNPAASSISISSRGGRRLESEGSQANLVRECSTATEGGNSDAFFYHMRARFGRDGRPLLLPKPTLAAHNGRLLMEYEWANAGHC